MNSVTREEMERVLTDLLDPTRMADYCPNGLQVEGKRSISRVISGVTASKALIETAIARRADAILVHHGLFWKGDPQVLRGFRKERLALLLQHNINVFAWHLPLDRHPEVGNNVMLGQLLGWTTQRTVGENGLIHVGELPRVNKLRDLQVLVSAALGNEVRCEGSCDPDREVLKVAWCTGGAPGYVEKAAQEGVDLYLTGELSEPAVHVARETGVVLMGAGHHATERGGPLALGQWVASHFGIEVEFHDLFTAV